MVIMIYNEIYIYIFTHKDIKFINIKLISTLPQNVQVYLLC